ncbi:CidA/LrgA family protein [Roseburia sp. 499]|uniref:CidA/LrgA family protein n=1 Tax=Roseburia sp. 499 TaxID=1261634 RepID=UPI0009526C57|nr:CidA/LrgA family protein [Roseburia sp. 499]WVK69800.1 CidA/LrgA family protein [Roseburia sp. 499]
MKYLKQFFIIMLISFIGEVLKWFIPLPIPASIYGLILMLTALCTGIIKVEKVEETSTFLIEIMPVMFIPASVGLLDSWGELRDIIFPIGAIIIITTIVVMGVTGKITQGIIRMEKREKNE